MSYKIEVDYKFNQYDIVPFHKIREYPASYPGIWVELDSLKRVPNNRYIPTLYLASSNGIIRCTQKLNCENYELIPVHKKDCTYCDNMDMVKLPPGTEIKITSL